jgi:hypothetical protein
MGDENHAQSEPVGLCCSQSVSLLTLGIFTSDNQIMGEQMAKVRPHNLVFKLQERQYPLSPSETHPSGIPGMEFPRGAISEIVGSPSSGCTTVFYSTLAQATARGEACAVIDATGAFDPITAAAAGVRLHQIVWIRTNGNLEHALQAADLLIHAGGFGLAVLDLCGIADRRFHRIPISYWYRCRRAIENTPTVLLVLQETAHVKACASMSIEMEQEGTRWSGNLLDEVRYRAEARKPVSMAPVGFSAQALG